MAVINVSVQISKTVATLDAASITSILNWVQTNVRDKLPVDTTADITLSINT